VLTANTVTGEVLLQLDDEALFDYGVTDAVERADILAQIEALHLVQLQTQANEPKSPLAATVRVPPQMSGYLWKRGPSNNQIMGWRRRWVTIENNAIRYFKGEDELAGIIYVEDVLGTGSSEGAESKYRACFFIDTSKNRRFVFCAESNEQRTKWLEAIDAATVARKVTYTLFYNAPPPQKKKKKMVISAACLAARSGHHDGVGHVRCSAGERAHRVVWNARGRD